ncbi:MULTISPECIES: hypothetical protein [unclassified Streptomyces]|uniref:hypothetical protein n=1 Tax=unclassified Streptomyces TaxID=2593676 RepID=UPI00278BC936|nr:MULTISPECIES: hypothetical protein [unclassified Streptomyces]
MSPKHGPWRAKAIFTPTAQRQIDGYDTQETIAVDRAIVAIQTDPGIGDLTPGREPLRDYNELGTGVRVVYYIAEYGSHVVIVYIEA